MEKQITPLSIWSYRFGVARGRQWVKEREADSLQHARMWIDVFQDDEPQVKFCVSIAKPTGEVTV